MPCPWPAKPGIPFCQACLHPWAAARAARVQAAMSELVRNSWAQQSVQSAAQTAPERSGICNLEFRVIDQQQSLQSWKRQRFVSTVHKLLGSSVQHKHSADPADTQL